MVHMFFVLSHVHAFVSSHIAQSCRSRGVNLLSPSKVRKTLVAQEDTENKFEQLLLPYKLKNPAHGRTNRAYADPKRRHTNV